MVLNDCPIYLTHAFMGYQLHIWMELLVFLSIAFFVISTTPYPPFLSQIFSITPLNP
jgi:hypothetical protein